MFKVYVNGQLVATDSKMSDANCIANAYAEEGEVIVKDKYTRVVWHTVLENDRVKQVVEPTTHEGDII